MTIPTVVQNLPACGELLANADHVDVKTVTSAASLRGFGAALLSYQPGWVTALYGVRAVFVRVLGMRQEGVPHAPPVTAETFPMQPGEAAYFFTVHSAAEEEHWIAGISDSHLDAWLGVIVEPVAGGAPRRFHVVTIVRYNSWAGPVYFNVIRPFHHLVVGQMARHAAQHGTA